MRRAVRRGLAAGLLAIALLAVPLSCTPSAVDVAPTIPRNYTVQGLSGAAPAPTGTPPLSGRSVASPRRVATPVRVRIPDIGVESELVRLGLTDAGKLEVPENYDLAGWYERGARPGEPGPAIIVGHVDSTTGPAVFFNLKQLVPGSRVEVQRADRSEVTYVIDEVDTFGKDDFPTERVYGRQGEPVLRLITCGGDFDRSSGHYEDNVVAFGQLSS